jgi:hypothetical protein
LPELGFVESALIALGADLSLCCAQLFLQLINGLGERASRGRDTSSEKQGVAWSFDD